MSKFILSVLLCTFSIGLLGQTILIPWGEYIGTNAIYKPIIKTNWDSEVQDYVGFYTSGNNEGNAAEKMRLIRNGNFGIGTSHPMEKLDVNGSIILKWGNYIGTNAIYRPIIKTSWNSEVQDYVGFYTSGNDQGNEHEKMRLIRNGNLGIGTSSPAYKLDVNGTIYSNNMIIKDGLTDLGGKNYRTSLVNFMSTNGTNSWESGFIAGIVGNPGDIIDYPGGLAFYTKAKDGSYNSTSLERMRISYNGNVGIGTTDPKNKLSVDGTIWAKEVKVTLKDAADWVFEDDYKLKSLDEVETFIKDNKHLPDVPSADEFREKDMNLAEMNNVLLQKVEELTLYLIEQNKLNQVQHEKIEQLEKKIFTLEKK